MRPVLRLTVEQENKPAPRMAMVVYYLEQYWPQAKHLCSLVLGRWRSQGWTVSGYCSIIREPLQLSRRQCLVEPVSLNTHKDRPVVFSGW